MTATPENVAWVVERLSTLAWMIGFPDTDQKLIDYAKILLPMIQGKTLVWVDPRLDVEERPPLPEGHMLCYFRPPEAVETDLDWIVQEIGRSAERFPMPVQVFRLYRLYFTPGLEEMVNKAQAALEGE